MALSDPQYNQQTAAPQQAVPMYAPQPQGAPPAQQLAHAEQSLNLAATPGVRNGMPPAEMSPMIPVEVGSLDDLNQKVAEYAIKYDNEGKAINTALPATELAQPQPYKLDEFSSISQQIAGNVQIDQEALATAMQNNDAAGLSTVLQSAIQSAAQGIMFASTGAANKLAHQQAAAVSDVTVNRMAATRSEQESIDSALQVVPHLSNEMGRQMLQTEVQKLRKQYPTAPSSLLGEFAARQLEAATSRPAPQQHEDTDWSQVLG